MRPQQELPFVLFRNLIRCATLTYVQLSADRYRFRVVVEVDGITNSDSQKRMITNEKETKNAQVL